MIVDDNTFVLESLSEYFRLKGYQVTSAENGRAAWEIFSEAPHSFDVILSDIAMPIMNGLDLLKKVRQEEHEVHFIIMTGHGELQFSIQALRLGAFDFLVKPYSLEILNTLFAKLESLHSASIHRQELFGFLREERMEFEIPSRVRYIWSFCNYFRNYLKSSCQSPPEQLHQIVLCLQESLMNAIVHGNLEISSEIKEKSWEAYEALLKEREQSPLADRKVLIHYSMKPHQEFSATENVLVMEIGIQDQGKGFDPQKTMSRLGGDHWEATSGRGLMIMRFFMDEITWNPTGTCIQMRKIWRFPKSMGNEALPQKSSN